MNEIGTRVEPYITGYLFNKASRQALPLSGTFELTPMCNFSCKMCYVRKTAAEVKSHQRKGLTLEQWLDIAGQIKEKGTIFLLLTGGEPLNWPNFWELYEELIRMGFLISINTNGSLIDEKAIERFTKLPPVRINITLYGASDETYERLCGVKNMFSRVDSAISGLQRSGVTVKLNGSLTPYNVCDLEKCAEYARQKGLIYEPVSYMFPPVRRDETSYGKNERFSPTEAAFYNGKAFRLLYGEEAYKKRMQAIADGAIPPPGLDESCVDPVDGKIRCRAGNASYWITWDGWLTPCGMMPEPRVELVNRTFSTAWQELNDICSDIRLSGKCNDCQNRKLCHSCAAMAYAETGSFAGMPEYLCEMVQAMKNLAEEELKKL